MLNSEKYKTAKERTIAFDVYCRKICTNEDGYCNHSECAFSWLDLDADEEKIENCPYCGRTCYALNDDGKYRVICHADMSCRYSSSLYTTEHEAIAHHNRVARAVMEAGKKEEQ